MTIKYGVYLIRQTVTNTGVPVYVIGMLLGKFDTEEEAVSFIQTSNQSAFQDCTIIKIYNNSVTNFPI